jgi:NADH:ubiquinone oxidoreductase subunit E
MEKTQEEKLEKIYQNCMAHGDNIITAMQLMQNEFGYIQEEAVNWYADRTNIPASRFYGVCTFYAQFHLQPRGKNIITVCQGTVCHVKGASRIIDKIRDDIKLKEGQKTTKDMQFTLENVNCVGACSIAPVVIVNDKVFGKQDPGKITKNLKAYKE